VTVVSFKRGWAWWVLLRVGLVFRDLLYYLGRRAGGGGWGQSPTCEYCKLSV